MLHEKIEMQKKCTVEMLQHEKSATWKSDKSLTKVKYGKKQQQEHCTIVHKRITVVRCQIDIHW